MPYEIDFIGINEDSKDASAIAMRWEKQDGGYTVGVFDGGFQIHGEALVNLLDTYYFPDAKEKVVDFMICSHPHDDHIQGLKTILENFTVRNLYMNRPWRHVKELHPFVRHRNMKPEGLRNQLRESYASLAELEELAIEKKVPIHDIFQGMVISDRLDVLSPSKEFYLEQLIESDKTPLRKDASFQERAMEFAKRTVNWIQETWNSEELRETVETEPDNETSTVILGTMEEESFLLTGDVGIKGLRKAIDYADSCGISLRDTVNVYEIPHHGGRHNVSPSILNDLLGEIVEEGTETGKDALVCAGRNSDHPLQMVVNAFRRRGVKVYKAAGGTVSHYRGNMPFRGWWNAPEVPFNSLVEERDDA